MKKYFLAGILIFALGCKGKEKPPKGIYSIPQMASFIKDIHILEASIREVRSSRDSTDRLFDMMEQRLFIQHEMVDSIYEESYAFYLEHPEYMVEIYAIVADSLSLEERLVEIQEEDEAAVED